MSPTSHPPWDSIKRRHTRRVVVGVGRLPCDPETGKDVRGQEGKGAVRCIRDPSYPKSVRMCYGGGHWFPRLRPNNPQHPLLVHAWVMHLQLALPYLPSCTVLVRWGRYLVSDGMVTGGAGPLGR